MSSTILKACLFAAAGVAALLSGTNAKANVASGSVYEVSQDVAGNATLANVPSGPAAVTFLAPTPLSFASSSLYTIGEYLASGGATILTGSANLGDTLDGTLFDFKGFVTVTNGQTFTAGHDDGLTLVIGGIEVIGEPGPTGFTDTSRTYSGPSGTLPFELVYGECCGSPADLAISLPFTPAAVPEPATLAVLGLGLTGLGLARRKRS